MYHQIKKFRAIKLKLKAIQLLLLVLFLSMAAKADDFKFRIKNTSKTTLTVFYHLSKKSGNFKLRSLIKLNAGEEKIKEVSVSKGDTISFYGQNSEEQTSVMVKKSYTALLNHKGEVFCIPIVVPEKENSSFESLDNLSLKLEHNKVLNFLLKMDSSSMSSFSLLENNFQNIYPLGTFIFVDTKTNRLLVPPLEPSFWNNSETYLSIQDSLSELVNTGHQLSTNVQGAYFLAKLLDSLKVNHTVEVAFKGRISLLRWKPSANANIYQVFNDKSVLSFLQNCYAQINDPDNQFQHYRLYFLSSYERIDDLEISGKQFYNFGNETDLSVTGSIPGFQLLSTNLGMLYTKEKTLSSYYSVQNAVLRTRAYDFTSLLFNGFKDNVKDHIIADTYARQHNTMLNIVDEYKSLVAYNPDPVRLVLQPIDPKDVAPAVVPLETTISNLSPYNPLPADTAKTAGAVANNYKIDTYNNKVKLFNAHLKEINGLFKQLDQVNTDLAKISAPSPNKGFSSGVNAPGLLKEIEVNTQIVRKE
jgi:hypothetical protein